MFPLVTVSFLVLTCNAFAQLSNNCVCVPYYQCKDDNILNIYGENLFDIRSAPPSHQSHCQSPVEICCHLQSDGRISDLRLDAEITTVPGPQLYSCGRRNEELKSVRNNNEAEFGELPWMAAILHDEKYKCAGSLIHPQVVLTVAHCLTKHKKEFRVRLGEWDLKYDDENLRHVDKNISAIIFHPKYQRSLLINDIALVILESPVEIQAHINNVCLPHSGTNLDHGKCTVSGWGKVSFDPQKKYQEILKKIEVPLVPREKCELQFRATRLGKYYQLPISFVCAGGEENQDACSGDGGAPLVCPIEGQEGRYQQIGIVAWGIGCGGKDIPGAYVNVPLFRDWIDSEMQKRNFDTTVYEYYYAA